MFFKENAMITQSFFETLAVQLGGILASCITAIILFAATEITSDCLLVYPVFKYPYLQQKSKSLPHFLYHSRFVVVHYLCNCMSAWVEYNNEC